MNPSAKKARVASAASSLSSLLAAYLADEQRMMDAQDAHDAAQTAFQRSERALIDALKATPSECALIDNVLVEVELREGSRYIAITDDIVVVNSGQGL